jgi:hypothetical protein
MGAGRRLPESGGHLLWPEGGDAVLIGSRLALVTFLLAVAALAL